jgi:hypothetical protein
MDNLIVYKPLDLLNHKKFDICSKVLYAKYRKNNINCSFAKDCYLRHIQIWNGFFEANPPKGSSDDFINSFDSLLLSINENGFVDPDKNYVATKDGSPYNGSHRVAASIVNNLDIYTKEDHSNGCEIADYNYFKGLGLEQRFLDEMVLEFVRNKRNSFTISIFSIDQKNQSDIDKIISEYSDILCSKDVELSEIGKRNYIISLYLGEKWLGDHLNKFSGAQGKYSSCFQDSNKMRVYVVTSNNPERLIYNETWRIASMIFNQNSFNFFNTQDRPLFEKFNLYFDNYKKLLSNINSVFFCISSSAVLSLYSIRECSDIDFLTLNKDYISFKTSEISSHESEAIYYRNKDEIIFDPSQHLYFDGIKFSTLQNVYDFKNKRGESKDIIDCELIKNKI